MTTGAVKDDTPTLSTDGQGTFLVAWQQDEDASADIMGQLFTVAGLQQPAFAIADAADVQDKPAVSFHEDSQQYLVVWEHKDAGASPRRIHARFVTPTGTTPNPSFVFDDFGTNPTLYPDVLGLDDGFLVTAHRSGNVFAGTVTPAGEPANLTVLSQSTNSQYRVNLAGAGDTALTTWESDELGTDYDLFGKLATLAPEPSQPETTVINYTYDPLYRLKEATYTGAVEAEFAYFYDAVGNMTSYQEVIGTDTASVTRVFNEANQLVISQDLGGEGTYSYSYDANGNLIQIRPPGDDWDGTVQYTFNQRNLLTAYDVHDGTDWVTLTEYAYDGNGDRVQQVVYENGTPIATNYTNDPQGLTQVLVAETDGDATYNVFGQGLISSETAGGTYFSLADGLGSVRVEVVDGVVTNISTYSPYGKLIAQIGWFGTTYGFAGEQYDQMTQLVYLRARYYNPYINQFQSRDPFHGYSKLPQTQNGYSYVSNNPINRVDPSGLCEEYLPDESCWSLYEEIIRRFPSANDKSYLYNLELRPLKDLPYSRLLAIRNELVSYKSASTNAFGDCMVGQCPYAVGSNEFVLPNVDVNPGNRFGSPSSQTALNWGIAHALTIQTKANQYGVPPELVAGLIVVEIDLDNTAIGLRLDGIVQNAYENGNCEIVE